MMIILGIDPGSAITGYGVIGYENGNIKLIDCGCVRTQAGTQLASRLTKIFNGVQKLIEQYSPQIMAVEDVFYGSNVKTLVAIGQTRGVILLAGNLAGLEIQEYSPREIKMSVVGNGQASKEQVQFMVQRILEMKTLPSPSDVADGLAVAICHTHRLA